MDFIVSSSSLLKHLQNVSGVLSSNNVLPILEDFLFEIENDQLIITATDLETVMKVRLEIEAKETGKICIPGRILLDYLKNNADQPLTFHIDLESQAIDITSDNGKYKIVGEEPDNFPKSPEADETTSFEIPSKVLSSAVQKTLRAVGNDELRAAMTGVYFELGAEDITCVATDAHRLIKYHYSGVSCPKEDNFIVPKKPLNILKSVLPTDDTNLKIKYNDSHFFVSYDEMELNCRLIDARFPDYRVVIPKENPYNLYLNTADFQNALRRVGIFANKSTNQVRLEISGSELQLKAQNLDFDFEGNERMNCRYEGEDMKIAFNARFLVDMLNAAESDEIVMELSTPGAAGIMRPIEKKENEDLLMLLMPLRLKD